jgi:integrase/recombinase XerD
MAKTHDPENERLKRSYLIYMREAKQHSEASLDAIAKALHRFEEHTRFRSFKAFRPEQATAFKRHLAGQRNQRTGKPLCIATQHSTLAALRSFFHWLTDRPGFRRRLSYADADYFSMSRGDTRVAHAQREGRVPSVEQVTLALDAMPESTAIERRDKAVLAFTLLTGTRDGALLTLRLKHVDLEAGRVSFDAREVTTKFGKTFLTWFFPVGEAPRRIVADWIGYLVEVEHWGPDDPLFPRARLDVGPERRLQPVGLDRAPWKTATPVRDIFREAFERVGLPYYSPHSLRKTLGALGERMCQNAEQLKAWSQNLGHDSVMTTLTSYGAVSSARQAEIIRSLAVGPALAADTLAQLKDMIGKLSLSAFRPP